MLIQQAQFARAVLGGRIARFREARGRRDAGASAIELAIITAVVVGLAVLVLVIVTNVVQTRANQINNNNNGIP
jgi:multisubunit Na+/H+ antiporter MnhC subunit